MVDREQLRVTLSDLRHIRDTWTRDVSNETLRRESHILRNLLLYDWITNCWKELQMPGACLLDTRTLRPILAFFPTTHIMFLQCGGAASSAHMTITGGIRLVFPPDVEVDDDEIFALMDKASKFYDYSELTKIGKFLQEPTLVSQGLVFTKRDIIDYAANKSGGAHYMSPKKYDINTLEGKRLIALDDANMNNPQGRDGVSQEILSIGQAIVNSNDVKRLMLCMAEELTKPWGHP